MSVDCEGGIRKAIREFWLNTVICGFLWHFRRVVRKKCVSAGMGMLLNENDETTEIKRKLTGTPPPPEDFVKETYGKMESGRTNRNCLYSPKEYSSTSDITGWSMCFPLVSIRNFELTDGIIVKKVSMDHILASHFLNGNFPKGFFFAASKNDYVLWL